VTGLVGRGLLVVVLMIFAGAAALAYSGTQPKRYSAEMRLEFGRLVSPDLQLLGGGYSEPQMDENIRTATEASEVKSFDVAQATAKAAPDLGTPGQIASSILVAPVRDTLTVVITAKESTPARAARLARVYGDQFIAIHNRRVEKRAGTTQKELERRYALLNVQEQRTVPGANLRFQINTLDVLRRSGTGEPQVIEEPRESASATSPNTAHNVLFGILFGLVVGIGLVALRAESPARAAAAAARRASTVAREGPRSQ